MTQQNVKPWTVDDMSKVVTTLSEEEKMLIIGFLAGLKVIRQADLSDNQRSA